MEDNFYEISKNWKQLEESWTRVDEKKSQKGLSKNDHQSATHGRATKVFAPKKGKGSYKRTEVGKVEENAGGGATCAGAPNVAGKAVVPSQQSQVKQAGFAAKLGQKKLKENFDIASLGAPEPQAAIAPPMGDGMEMDAEVESPAVSDIIAALQARYPGAIIEISVSAPDGHRFTDEDVACATEVANASETPEELGGAWAKNEVEGEEGEESEEGTKPLKEGAYGFPSGGADNSADDAGDDEGGEEEEETEEGGEEEKPAFGGEKEESGEGEEGGEEGDVSSCAGISQDCIALSPEGWSAFLVQADQQTMGGEEEGEMDESGNTEPNPDQDPAIQGQVEKDQAKVAGAAKAGTLGKPKPKLPVDPTDRI